MYIFACTNICYSVNPQAKQLITQEKIKLNLFVYLSIVEKASIYSFMPSKNIRVKAVIKTTCTLTALSNWDEELL